MAKWRAEELFYCSNVHPGETLSEVKMNLCHFVDSVRQKRCLTGMQAGLWLSQQAVSEWAACPEEKVLFADLLKAKKITVRSLNGFPYGGFHQGVVKETVYQPAWDQRARLDYTIQLATLLADLIRDSGDEGTISTLPLGFADDWNATKQQQAEQLICELLDFLVDLEKSSGQQIRVCLEMEPGCVLEKTDQLIHFFNTVLPLALQTYGLPTDIIHRHLGVCFDVCHQAVMFEDIGKSLTAITEAEIVIGKIQVSSALRIVRPDQAKALLSDFAEPRYLHQLTTKDRQGERVYFLDLEEALLSKEIPWDSEWRVHFHVPIQAEQLESALLSTTRQTIIETCHFLAENPSIKPHLEVETYTWGVMPEAIQPKSDSQLIGAITQELNWLQSTLNDFNLMAA